MTSPDADDALELDPAWRAPGHLGPDVALLLCAVRTVVAGRARGSAASSAVAAQDATVDWARIAAENKLSVIALQGLGAAVERLPAAARELAEAQRRRTITLNTANLMAIRRVLPLLESEGVKALVFKGPVGQLATYGGYFMKPSTDVDLLVAERDYDRARRALDRDGLRLPPVCDSPWWRRFLGEQHLVADDVSRAPVDLHHKLQQPGCPAPRHLDRFLAETETILVAGRPTPTLSPVNAVLLACMSLAKALTHREASGGHAADLAARLLAGDTGFLNAVRDAARSQGLSNTLALGLQVVRALFGAAAPRAPAESPLGVTDADLADLVLTPGAPSINWPRRTAMLQRLCDTPASFAAELALAATAELCRRIYEPRGSEAGA